MIGMRDRIGLSLVIAVAVSSGCGQGTPAATAQQSTPQAGAPPASSPAPAKKNACALIDREQIEAIAGAKLDMLHNIEEEDLTVCELSDRATNAMLVSVTVHWRGGQELARVNQAAMSMAKQMLNDDDVDIQEITGSKKVRGLADKAFYSDLMPSWVLKKDVMIEVISPRFAHEQTRAVFLSVARTALPRL